jgi:hypothetical protein
MLHFQFSENLAYALQNQRKLQEAKLIFENLLKIVDKGSIENATLLVDYGNVLDDLKMEC